MCNLCILILTLQGIYCTLHFCCECVGATPLHYAADLGHANVLSVLLNSPNNGIDVQVMKSNFLAVYFSFCVNIFTKFMIGGGDTIVHVYTCINAFNRCWSVIFKGVEFLWNNYSRLLYCRSGQCCHSLIKPLVCYADSYRSPTSPSIASISLHHFSTEFPCVVVSYKVTSIHLCSE